MGKTDKRTQAKLRRVRELQQKGPVLEMSPKAKTRLLTEQEANAQAEKRLELLAIEIIAGAMQVLSVEYGFSKEDLRKWSAQVMEQVQTTRLYMQGVDATMAIERMREGLREMGLRAEDLDEPEDVELGAQTQEDSQED